MRKKLLFLHGALGAAANFNPLIEKCNNHYECISIDFPGHGNNNNETIFSIKSFTEFLLQYIPANFNEPVSVFGYSMGGYIALNALTENPQLFDKIMTLATKLKWDETEGKKQAQMLNADKIEEKIPHYAQSLSQLHPAHDWKNVVKNTATLIEDLSSNPPLKNEKLMQVENHIWLGLGDRDNMVSMSETAEVYRLCKNGSMYLIPDMQHPIEKMNTSLVSAMIQDFF